MKISVVTIGTRGDVQPLLGLAQGLRLAGHDVVFGTHKNFEEFVTSAGLDFFPIAGDIQQLLLAPAGLAFMGSGRTPLRSGKLWFDLLKPCLSQIMVDTWSACQGADLIIGSGTVPWVSDIGEALCCPVVHAPLWPSFPIADFPPMTFCQSRSFGKVANLALYAAYGLSIWLPLRKYVNEFRVKTLSLPSILIPKDIVPSSVPDWRVLLGVSPSVVPKPSNWDEKYCVTGFWFLESEDSYTPSADLVSFLDNGTPPVCIGFGSIRPRDPEEFTRRILKALEISGERAIILSGWGGISDSEIPESVFMTGSVPHDWLFPRVSTVVYHGGAGTTAAVLRAGIPPIVVPFFGDQFFWGSRVFRLGVGPAPVPGESLTENDLAVAIKTAVGDSDMRSKASKLGQAIREEQGVEKAIAWIEDLDPARRRTEVVSQGTTPNSVGA